MKKILSALLFLATFNSVFADINITNSTGSVKLEITTPYTLQGTTISAQIIYINKSDFEIKSLSTTIIVSNKDKEYRFLYSDVTSPSAVSANALALVIKAFLDAGGPPLGSVSISGTPTVVVSSMPTVISISGTPALALGASTSALQGTGNTSLSSIDGKITAVNTGAVVVTTMPTVSVSVSSMPTVVSISGTLPLATGAATSALQGTGNTTLTAISGKLPSTLGAKTGSASLSIVPASDASFNTSTTINSIYSAAATEGGFALESGGNLAAITLNTSSTSSNVNSVLNQLTPGAGAVAKAEDAASLNADGGIPSLAIRKATPANTSGADGDYEFLQVYEGKLYANSIISGTASINGTLSKFRNLTVGNTGQNIKASAGNFYKIRVVNTDAALIVIKIYDKATAPTSADTPIATFTCSGGDGSSFGEEYDLPMSFSLGLGVRVSTSTTDNSTAEPTNKPIIEIGYL